MINDVVLRGFTNGDSAASRCWQRMFTTNNRKAHLPQPQSQRPPSARVLRRRPCTAEAHWPQPLTGRQGTAPASGLFKIAFSASNALSYFRS